MKKKLMVLTVVSMSFSSVIFAQEDSTVNGSENLKKLPGIEESIGDLKGKIAGIEESYLETKATVDKLKKIKVSGYIQAQMRIATDTTGQLKADYSNNYDIGEFQGGKLPAATRSVFQIRRARFKLAYESELSQFAIQLDCLPFSTKNALSDVTQDSTKTNKKSTSAYLTGSGISLKDAYFRFQDPWLKSIALKAGIFDRPFGFEISYSSSSRESPERSRVFQTLFPGERDMGISLEYLAGDNLPSAASLFNVKAGLFAGNGINLEIDDIRDFIGRFGFSIPVTAVNLSIDGGVSGYVGSVLNRSDSLYLYNSDGSIVKENGHKWDREKRKYLGLDGQIYYGNIPVFGGVTLRGEYLQGIQPGTLSSNVSPKSDIASVSAIYSRKFKGYYAMGVLNIDPIKCQLVGKYDYYDPNIDISASNSSSTADISYTTKGVGIVYHWDENVKLIAYYDMIRNETMSSGVYAQDVNDNVFTLRIQYKF